MQHVGSRGSISLNPFEAPSLTAAGAVYQNMPVQNSRTMDELETESDAADGTQVKARGPVILEILSDDATSPTRQAVDYEVKRYASRTTAGMTAHTATTLSFFDQSSVILWSVDIHKVKSIPVGVLSVIVHECQDVAILNDGKPDISLSVDKATASSSISATVHLRFCSAMEVTKFIRSITDLKCTGHLQSSDSNALQSYFQYYGKMSNQMNMLQDVVRTKSYRDAIHCNPTDFVGARVMDVGAGSGILSFFSAQNKAQTVYVVEASSIATAVASLASSNLQWGSQMRLLHKTVETVNLQTDLDGEKVDVLVSEPIGTFLFNERMVESFLYARDNFLKPGGCMYPNRCKLFLAPFSDAQLFADITNRCNFWSSPNFYGLKLSSVLSRAIDEQFRQPVVDTIDPASIVCQAWHQEDFDLETIDRASLSDPCLVHGIASWFDILFEGSDAQIGFSTAPWCPQTHWQQIRFVFRQPLAVNPGQVVSGSLRMVANSQQSYYITTAASIENTHVSTSSTIIDLKDPDYRYYTCPQNSYVSPVVPTVEIGSTNNSFNKQNTAATT